MKHIIKRLLQRLYLIMVELGFIKNIDHQIQILLASNFKQMRENSTILLNFEDVGFNVYSPTNEDGILLYIFSIIGMANKKCVDIGAGNVRGSTTANLIINHGFSGLLIDGNIKNIELSRGYYARHPDTKLFPPTLISEFVTAENINKILEENNYVGEIDLLCIDIDGIDYWIWKAINVIQPRVVVVEYQDILGPDRAWTIPYKPDFNVRNYPVNKSYNNYCGASLRTFTKLGEQKGYRLIGCNRGGWNAFFVKNSIVGKYLPEVSVQSCFKYEWNQFGINKRFPLVKDMDWEEV